MSQRDEIARTLAIGESALSLIRENDLPAFPRSYEFWYTYAAGFNQSLNRALQDAIRDKGAVSSDDVDRIYDELLSPTRFGDRFDGIGKDLSGEIARVQAVVGAANGQVARYGAALDGASAELASGSAEDVAAIVQRLRAETVRMQKVNGELEANLLASRRQVDELQANLTAIRQDSLTDALTGVANRKHFDRSLVELSTAAESSRKPFTLMMCDVDHFKSFNDRYGHQTGDQVLRLVAGAIKAAVKGSDLAARYGGEEFAVLLPETTLAQAAPIADKVRVAVMGKELVKRSTGERLGRVTISIGVAQWCPGDSPSSLIERSDEALYAAKRGGRNRVVTEDEIASIPKVA